MIVTIQIDGYSGIFSPEMKQSETGLAITHLGVNYSYTFGIVAQDPENTEILGITFFAIGQTLPQEIEAEVLRRLTSCVNHRRIRLDFEQVKQRPWVASVSNNETQIQIEISKIFRS